MHESQILNHESALEVGPSGVARPVGGKEPSGGNGEPFGTTWNATRTTGEAQPGSTGHLAP